MKYQMLHTKLLVSKTNGLAASRNTKGDILCLPALIQPEKGQHPNSD